MREGFDDLLLYGTAIYRGPINNVKKTYPTKTTETPQLLKPFSITTETLMAKRFLIPRPSRDQYFKTSGYGPLGE